MNNLLNFFEGFTQNAQQNDLVYLTNEELESDLHGYAENYRFNEETQSFDDINITDNIEVLVMAFHEWEANDESISGEIEMILQEIEI